VKQDQFEKRATERWIQFERDLNEGDASRTPEFPARFRRICQDLALARDRGFSGALVERLNRYALRGHHELYRTRLRSRVNPLQFFTSDFPRTVRSEWRLLLLISLLFYGGMGAVVVAIQQQPDLVYSILEPAMVDQMEQMYDPNADTFGEVIPQSRFSMFGFYVMNNVSIGFRTFAMGILLGVGALVIIAFNALTIGAVFGHLFQVGFHETLLSFISGHSSFELTAITLAGVAGMRLGLAVLAPGQLTRVAALRLATPDALTLVYGFASMLVVAAVIEAFWSPTQLPLQSKLQVGAALWFLHLLYFGLVGLGPEGERGN
jgi:uncharacterized membrane protein SpoIIM required for sporulation